MGYNTVIIIDNDRIHEIGEAQKTFTKISTTLSNRYTQEVEYRWQLAQHLEEDELLDNTTVKVMPPVDRSQRVIYVLDRGRIVSHWSPKTKTIKGVKYYLVPVDKDAT